MKTAVVVIDGIKFPFFLTDHAIAWAKKEGAQLCGLFLTSGSEMPEGYAFPSDIDLAQNTSDIKDAENDSATITKDQVKLFNTMIKSEGIAGYTEWLNDPTLDQVLEKIKQASLLFVAPGYGEIEQQAVTRFSLQDLIDKAPCAVEEVMETGD